MSTFTAQYATRCTDCGHTVEPGDEAVFVADVVVHAACQPSAARAQAQLNRKPCPKCFIVPAINGACGCDA